MSKGPWDEDPMWTPDLQDSEFANTLGHFNVLDWEMDKIACKPCSAILVSEGSEICHSFIGQNLICPVCDKEINDAR